MASFNCVGYQNVAVKKFGVQSLTFTSLTKTEANMTLGDIATNSKSDGNNTWVDGWNPDGDYLCFIDTNAKIGSLYTYIPQWKIDEDPEWEGYEAGWYDDEWNCLNTTKVPFGTGFIIKAFSANAGKNPQLVFNGQVKNEGKDIPVSAFIAVGACRPSRVYLGDISTNSESDGNNTWVNGWNPDGDYLCFIDENAKMGSLYTYIPQWKIEEDPEWEGYDAGWYDDEWNCLNETKYAEPGDGFIIKAFSAKTGKEPTITIKSALAD